MTTRMLEKLSNYIATEIKNADPHGPGTVEVLEYELSNRINVVAILLLTILWGWLLGHLGESLIAMLSFAIARKFSGGVHLKSLTLCAIVSSSLFAVIPTISLNQIQFIILNIVTFISFLCYAPRDFDELNAQVNRHKTKIYALLSFLLGLLFLSPLVTLSFFIQALTILPIWNYWKGGEKNES